MLVTRSFATLLACGLLGAAVAAAVHFAHALGALSFLDTAFQPWPGVMAGLVVALLALLAADAVTLWHWHGGLRAGGGARVGRGLALCEEQMGVRRSVERCHEVYRDTAGAWRDQLDDRWCAYLLAGALPALAGIVAALQPLESPPPAFPPMRLLLPPILLGMAGTLAVWLGVLAMRQGWRSLLRGWERYAVALAAAADRARGPEPEWVVAPAEPTASPPPPPNGGDLGGEPPPPPEPPRRPIPRRIKPS